MVTQLCHHILTHVILPMWLFLKHKVFNSKPHIANQYTFSGLSKNSASLSVESHQITPTHHLTSNMFYF